MTAYPGNTSLAPEVRERVLTTFRQTLDLYKQGNVADAVAGCELLLKLDPLFEPAKRLLAKTDDPFSEINLDEFLPQDFTDQLAEARQALREREFQRAADICTTILATDFSHTEAQAIAQQAQEKLEAEPFVVQFLQKCKAQLEAGNIDAARASLDKARALDPDYPSIYEFETKLEKSGAPSLKTNPQTIPLPPVPPPDESFIVDSSPFSGGSGTPAADFGFTFEEESRPGSGFTFEPPVGESARAAVPEPDLVLGEAQTFDFSMASVETSPEDQRKIAGYLADGDRLFDAGDNQGAIDTWSKVFLIDVTNDEASERIERARKRRVEIESKVEDLLVAGALALDRSDLGEARLRFEEVLAADPGNARAEEQLRQLDLRDAKPKVSAPATGPEAKVMPTGPGDDFFDDFASSPTAAYPGGVSPQPRIAADQEEDEERETRPAPAAAVKHKAAAGKGKLIGMVAGLIVALGLGWFAYTKLFGSGSDYDEAMTQTTINEATKLGNRGQFDQAIALLVGIKPGDPLHDRALELIDDLKKKKQEAAGMIDGRPAGVVFNELLDQGKAAFAKGDFLAAKAALERAAGIRQLPASAQATLDAANAEASKLDRARQSIAAGDYDAAVAMLEPMMIEDPENVNVRQMLAAAHFNLGVLALREQRGTEAQQQFGAVLEIDPGDELARRSQEIAARYEGETKDLLYLIYVKHLPTRTIGGEAAP